MNGKRDIDTASEDLREEEDEQTLPELELTDAPAGTLAAGRAAIARAVKHAPSSPGVYRMIDEKGDVLYVGKAKNIKKRVTNYTRPVAYDARIARMISGTVSMEFITTKTETEALLLEANLIKRLRPRFNVLLRDDKSFPYILITSDHWAPQILKHRGARTRPGHYYGPFANAGAVNRTINALQRAFLLRSCSDSFFESRTRPCLLHQIKRCSAPCTREIDFAGYTELVREANEFLSGHSRTVQKELAQAMDKASEALDFEHAAIFRDRLAALSAVQSHQGINPRSVEEADVFAVHQAGGYNCIEVFFFRTGQNWGNRAYFPKADRALAEGEVLSAFMAQFYDDKPPPRLVLVSHDFDERELMADALTTKAGRKVEVSVPQRGERKELVQHALANAREALARKLADTSSQQKLLKGLAETFGLPREPRRIEVYDNSHIAGTNAVGGMVVAGPEGFRKNQYRKFNIRSTDLTPGDDYGMMREVLQRRFKRLLDEAPRAKGAEQPSPLAGEGGEPPTGPREARPDDKLRGEPGEGSAFVIGTDPSPALASLGHPLPQGEREREQVAPDDHIESDERDESPWPDLVLIDGGQGQLKAAVDTLTEMGITDVPLVSIAKGMDREAGRETFFMPGRAPFKLPPRDPLLYYIERLRDEAHRFAIGSHRARRKKDIREAGLQEIPGIGPTRKRALLRHFGTVKAIERASLPDLANVPGINAETARKIYEFFHEQGAR
ncbi:excinuclease ABC subunit UvrC [Pseudolabrys taiwanensis]|uniref:UvrABC system protein C n=1 Tax=Pseudolabrys taiwanensis TaxID=331696 RepID=A0A346A254_9HYPH|nr:excinuclease ABC subunit UvrC [Pseudolabrys taiwanensis]AXK83251.1 excinuclease ABC subunit UvrC [Pseudolabrys taiwanensis]